MAYDLHIFDGPLLSNPFIDDFAQIDPSFYYNPFEESIFSNETDPNIVSSSPPRHQLENLSIFQTTHDQFLNFPFFEEVKTEGNENQFSQSSIFGYQNFGPHSYDGSEFMQRSFSSNTYFDGKNNFLNEKREKSVFESCFDHLMENNDLEPKIASSPEKGYITAQMRRVCSTGDLQNMKKIISDYRLPSSPLASESSYIEEANIKVGRYSAEERKEKILRYRAKRTQRNFNKTIKYACRKTLADNRPRIRGRFARNDEPGETPKYATYNNYEEEYDIWIDGYNGEEKGGVEVSVFNMLGLPS